MVLADKLLVGLFVVLVELRLVNEDGLRLVPVVALEATVDVEPKLALKDDTELPPVLLLLLVEGTVAVFFWKANEGVLLAVLETVLVVELLLKELEFVVVVVEVLGVVLEIVLGFVVGEASLVFGVLLPGEDVNVPLVCFLSWKEKAKGSDPVLLLPVSSLPDCTMGFSVAMAFWMAASASLVEFVLELLLLELLPRIIVFHEE